MASYLNDVNSVTKMAVTRFPSMQYRLRTVLKIHQGWIKSLDIDPYNALLASSSMDCTIKITDIETKQQLITIPQNYICEEVMFSRAHPYILCASLNGLIKCYDLVDREFTREYYGHSSAVLCLDSDADRVFSGSADSTVGVWDMRAKDPISMLKGHRLPITDVAFSNGLIYSCSMDGTVNIWDDRHCGSTVAVFDSSVDSMCFCGSSLFIATRKGIFEYEDTLRKRPSLVVGSIQSLARYDDDSYIVGTEGCVMIKGTDPSSEPSCFEITGSASSLRVAGDKATIVCGGTNKTIEFLEVNDTNPV